jgi:thymidylate synthase (FAD)
MTNPDSDVGRYIELLAQEFPIGTHGFVKFVDCMGDDAAIAEAARVSYGAGTKQTSDDVNLIRYLMRHRHTTPFEMAEIKLLIQMPMDTWRQMIRHRTASVNEYSTRYSEAINFKSLVPEGEWRRQSTNNKQGSEGVVTEWPENWIIREQPEAPIRYYSEPMVGEGDEVFITIGPGTTPQSFLTDRECNHHAAAEDIYSERLNFGVAREVARKDLPLSTYTRAYWKMDLHNLFHFLGLRMESHAQQEIREYANVIGNEIVAKLFPISWEAFCDYRLNALTLTAIEQYTLGTMLSFAGCKGELPPFSMDTFRESLPSRLRPLDRRNRERDECLAKFQELELVEVKIPV